MVLQDVAGSNICNRYAEKMKLGEALSTVEKTLRVEYFKDSSGKITARYNGKTMSLDEFEKLTETDKDAKVLMRATGQQNKYYPKQVKKFNK